jgi:hypothetical protein
MSGRNCNFSFFHLNEKGKQKGQKEQKGQKG